VNYRRGGSYEVSARGIKIGSQQVVSEVFERDEVVELMRRGFSKEQEEGEQSELSRRAVSYSFLDC